MKQTKTKCLTLGTPAAAAFALVQGRVAVLQALSGTGSLRVGAAFIAKFMPGATVYISNPTWGNHKNIFGDAGACVCYPLESGICHTAGCGLQIPLEPVGGAGSLGALFIRRCYVAPKNDAALTGMISTRC